MKKQPQLDRYFYIAGWIILAAVLLFVIGWSFYRPFMQRWIVKPCLIHTTFGFYCPGCGGTRAVYHLLHGEIIQSFLMHPLVLYATAIGGWFMISQSLHRIFGERFHAVMHVRLIYVYIALVIIILNCVIKNSFILGTML